jgi:hypothetical protein
MSDFVEATILEDTPEDEVPAGIYVSAADMPAYGWLDALVAEGVGTDLGVKYDPDGRKWRAVALGEDFVRNAVGQIRIGRDFFTTALRDYEDWRSKWWREAIQNGVDAGATRIDCTVAAVADNSVLITCRDNGRGMDEDTLVNKFLVLGGTTKTAGTTRGGFGKAKELLVLPWLSWEIHTRDRIVSGVGVEYEVRQAEYLNGTEVRVLMPEDQATHAPAAMEFITRCYLPTVRFTVNDVVVEASLACGQEVRDFEGKAVLCHNKNVAGRTMLVRTMGLFMFDSYISSAVEGTVIVELTGSSIDLLTANRDGFRDAGLKRSVEEFTSQLAADIKSALRKKQGLLREKYKGREGRYQTRRERDVQSTILSAVGSLAPEGGGGTRGKAQELSETQMHALVSAFRYVPQESEPEDAPGLTRTTFTATPELAEAMLSGTRLPGPDAVEAAIKQLSWQLDFYLMNEVEDFHVPSKFRPEKMTPTIRKLARTWGELCRFVLIQLGCEQIFGIGFVFDQYTGAQYTHEEDEHWLMLNPVRDPNRIGSGELKSEHLLNQNNDDDLMWLYAAAVHECTHMADGISYHDESFAAALTRNFAKTSGKQSQVRAIKKLVSAQERGAAAPKRRTAPAREVSHDTPSYWVRWPSGSRTSATSTEAAKEMVREMYPRAQFYDTRDGFEAYDADIQVAEGYYGRLAQNPESASYRIQHQAPGKEGAPLYDVTANEVYPKDFYARSFEYHPGHRSDGDAVDKIFDSRDKPDRKVWIYRAVPKGVLTIYPGDWVAITKAYAVDHGKGSDMNVIVARVLASEIFTEGDSFQEWGYVGPEIPGRVVHRPRKPLTEEQKVERLQQRHAQARAERARERAKGWGF